MTTPGPDEVRVPLHYPDPQALAAALKAHNLARLIRVEAKDFELMHKGKYGQNFQTIINEIDKLSKRVTDDILLASSLKEQQKMYDFYLQVLQQSFNNNDIASALAIWGGLNAASLIRLSYLKNKKNNVIFDYFDKVFLQSGSYSNLRKHLNSIVGTPPLSVFISDLTFMHDGNLTSQQDIDNALIEKINKSKRAKNMIGAKDIETMIKSIEQQKSISKMLRKLKKDIEADPNNSYLKNIENELTRKNEENLVLQTETKKKIFDEINKKKNEKTLFRYLVEAENKKQDIGKVNADGKEMMNKLISKTIESANQAAQTLPNVEIDKKIESWLRVDGLTENEAYRRSIEILPRVGQDANKKIKPFKNTPIRSVTKVIEENKKVLEEARKTAEKTQREAVGKALIEKISDMVMEGKKDFFTPDAYLLDLTKFSPTEEEQFKIICRQFSVELDVFNEHFYEISDGHLQKLKEKLKTWSDFESLFKEIKKEMPTRQTSQKASTLPKRKLIKHRRRDSISLKRSKDLLAKTKEKDLTSVEKVKVSNEPIIQQALHTVQPLQTTSGETPKVGLKSFTKAIEDKTQKLGSVLEPHQTTVKEKSSEKEQQVQKPLSKASQVEYPKRANIQAKPEPMLHQAHQNAIYSKERDLNDQEVNERINYLKKHEINFLNEDNYQIYEQHFSRSPFQVLTQIIQEKKTLRDILPVVNFISRGVCQECKNHQGEIPSELKAKLTSIEQLQAMMGSMACLEKNNSRYTKSQYEKQWEKLKGMLDKHLPPKVHEPFKENLNEVVNRHLTAKKRFYDLSEHAQTNLSKYGFSSVRAIKVEHAPDEQEVKLNFSYNRSKLLDGMPLIKKNQMERMQEQIRDALLIAVNEYNKGSEKNPITISYRPKEIKQPEVALGLLVALKELAIMQGKPFYVLDANSNKITITPKADCSQEETAYFSFYANEKPIHKGKIKDKSAGEILKIDPQNLVKTFEPFVDAQKRQPGGSEMDKIAQQYGAAKKGLKF